MTPPTLSEPLNKFQALLVLGRVSNLPTVWTNVLAAAVITSQLYALPVNSLVLSQLLLAMSLLYLGGMFLNDAIDARWDRQHQVARPIVLGAIGQNTVFALSLLQLTAGALVIFQIELTHNNSALVYGHTTALVAAIIFYNLLHKKLAASRLLMGFCRAGIFLVTAAVITGKVSAILPFALLLAGYISGITFLAQFEHLRQQQQFSWFTLVLLFSPVLLFALLPKSIFAVLSTLTLLFLILHKLRWRVMFDSAHNYRPPIGALLSLIPLFDAVLLVAHEHWFGAMFCVAVYVCIPSLQRWVAPS
ncbi:hypothetical protein ACSLBF_03730 [Pseudoalteromonas sp. T1lg65]|uniref:hypothetical protein n=1 Tax=Pseudoalteromonas sp. T1lg65 TaxID=2077101 RepID=UPI003F7A6BCF